ncbi:transcription-repair coupling factor [Candidatus Pantoea edessiphila]|uniref:Transcription-repair-coupling factor n=1 Tax=Candidatus Pantoea edessiphila TaxID=2044610 RepID=A0A2P5SWZ9_9GAMM|nr:transcription-repair coupling factor [Candidatus Pantoea edessiphila]PPI86832.1 transcription-repair coupling factor [Candidatus Pantoea edessiphila]
MINKQRYPIPKRAGDIYHLGQLVGNSCIMEYTNIIENYFGLILIVTSNTQDSLQLFSEISQLTKHYVNHFPDWGIAPYSRLSPNQNIISNRISILCQLSKIKHGIIIISIKTLMQLICPSDFLYCNTLLIRQGEKLSNNYFKNKLEKIGYKLVDHILEPGEYNITKSCLYDLFPIGYDRCYRINLFNDDIHDINEIDLKEQKLLNRVSEINLFPKHEFPTNKDALKFFCNRWKRYFNKTNSNKDYIYQNIDMGILPAGIEYWYPLFFDKPLFTFFDYLPLNTIIINHSTLEKSAANFWQNIQKFYDDNNINSNRSLLKPTNLWIKPDCLINKLNDWPQIKITDKKLPKKQNNINLGYQLLPPLISKKDNKFSLKYLARFIKKFNGYIILFAKNKIYQTKIQKLLEYIELNPVIINNFNESKYKKLSLMIGNIRSGFIDTMNNKAIICENDIINKNFNTWDKDEKNWNQSNLDKFIFDIERISHGQPVVHLEHGIGRYMGLITIKTNNIDSEYLILSYADDTKLYVPVSSLHLISCYIGYTNDNIPLHRLGSDIWLRARQKAIEKIRDVAAELLDIYANRNLKCGYSFKYNKSRYQSFCSNFPFNITLDQQKAINEVIEDMCKPITMDRLICGDVGFGKTEVAIRASFIAVEDKKQVAILVPTTILAQQYYENFKNRFNNWSVKIEMLSDFRTDKEQKSILEQTKKGAINILIGTHKILNKNIKWKNLGLLIVDEEHRFGVCQKEYIKAIYSDIDIITLTATPIPRTLHMAITGMRDISIIATPPEYRLPVKTFVSEFNSEIIREAILREILRGGQVYYLHNKVSDIEKIANYISKLIPEARVTIAHGQMPESDLEQVMNDFCCQYFNVLVCTTIIENGMDIPNANTIIIDRADRLGLAQLYQLRGRVGRSHYQAYAWLLIPSQKFITNRATKRFEVISSLKELGTGFTLAISDLEIRGSGEVLGEKQSGQVEILGLSLYMELLENYIHDIKSNKSSSISIEDLVNNKNIEIELQIPAIIPEYFIKNANTRLSLYKKIATATSEYNLQELQNEMINNFGLLPDATINLLKIASIRLQARQLGLCKIKVNDTGGYFDFSLKNKVDLIKLVNLIQKEPDKWKFDGNTKLRVYCNEIKSQNSRIEWIKNFITYLLIV